MPIRIASLIASATEIFAALGLESHLVAISHECDYPPALRSLPRVTRSHIRAGNSSREIDEQVRSLAASAAPLYELDVEQLAALRPDLIVTQAQCDVCAVRYADVLAAVASRAELRSSGRGAQPAIAGRRARQRRAAGRCSRGRSRGDRPWRSAR